MAILRAYASLRVDGALVRLLVGEFISSIGDWLYLVALLVVVYERSNDAALLGIVGAARVLPYVVFSVPAGYIADHYDRRLVLLSTDIARGTIMVALAVLVAVDGPLWAIVALSILATCFSSFFGPTIGAFLPTLVGDESRLGPANSAWASLDNLAFIVGPAIGGLLIAASGLSLAFALNAISFAVVAVVLWRLPRGRRSDEPSAAAAADAGSDGAATSSVVAAAERRYLVPLVGLGTLNVVSSFAFGGLSILTVVLAGSAFGASEAATGYLNAAIGVGGVVGAILAGGLVLRPRLAPALIGGAILLAVGLAVLGVVGSLGPALVGMAVASAGSLTVEVVDATIFQRIVPDAVRGRALGVIATVGDPRVRGRGVRRADPGRTGRRRRGADRVGRRGGRRRGRLRHPDRLGRDAGPGSGPGGPPPGRRPAGLRRCRAGPVRGDPRAAADPRHRGRRASSSARAIRPTDSSSSSTASSTCPAPPKRARRRSTSGRSCGTMSSASSGCSRERRDRRPSRHGPPAGCSSSRGPTSSSWSAAAPTSRRGSSACTAGHRPRRSAP